MKWRRDTWQIGRLSRLLYVEAACTGIELKQMAEASHMQSAKKKRLWKNIEESVENVYNKQGKPIWNYWRE